MNPRIARTLLVVVALGALPIAWITREPESVVTITYAYSTDAADLLDDLIIEFNKLGEEAGGDTVRVESSVDGGLSSGKTLDRIDGGSLKPVVWTPASSLWVNLLNAGPSKRAPDSNPSLVQSPQVVATFDADLGTKSSETLEGVFDLATNESLKLGHTDPNTSTSGLSAVLSEFSLATESAPNTLTMNDVLDVGTRDEVGRMEASIAHYVDIADDFSDQWCEDGDVFADAAYIQETTWLKFNEKCGQQLSAVYPQDVRLVADYPYVILDASWVSSSERQAAEAFGRWLDGRLSRDCEHVRDAKFRKGERCKPVGAGELRGKPEEPPTGEVLREVQQAWHALRRPANVELVVDESAPMGQADRMPPLKEALLSGAGSRPFLDCPGTRESVGMMVFGGDDQDRAEALPAGPYSDAKKDALEVAIKSLSPGRGKALLRDAIAEALRTLEGQDPAAINTIVLMTFGVDGGSEIQHDVLLESLRTRDVQIIAVPYNDDEDDLQPMIDLVNTSVGRWHEFSKKEWTDVPSVSEFVCQFL